VLTQGGGNYQSLINDSLQDQIAFIDKPLEDALRKFIREELRHAS